MSFKVHPIKGYIQTTYLVEDDEGLLLFDSGTSLDSDIILNFIEETLKRPLSDLKLIALSHTHPDHAGGLKQIQNKTGAPLAASSDSNLWYKGLKGFICHKVDLMLTLFVANRLKKKLHCISSPRKFKIDYVLKDKDSLPYFKNWFVYKNDGHTIGDLSFYNKDTVYVGDNLIKLKKKFRPPYPLHSPTKYLETIEFYKNFKIFILAHDQICELSVEDLDKVKKLTPKTPQTLLKSLKSQIFKFLKVNL